MNKWEALSAALLALFVTLKLTGIIAWSWLWVLAPLWVPIGSVAIFFLIGLIIIGMFAADRNFKQRKARHNG